MALINQRTIKLDVSEVVTELKRLNYNLEKIFQVDAHEVVPNRDFDPDDYCGVFYTDEAEELVQQHLGKLVGGVKVE